MPTITTMLQDKTYKILYQFIRNTAYLTVNNDLDRTILLQKTAKLFTDLNELSKEEFAKIFTVYNFTSSDVVENEKYQEILNYLLTAVIEKYSQTDLLRYFFPEYLSQKETRPEYSNNLSRIGHWFQLIGYWLRQLRNKPIYRLKTEHNGLADSIEYIKASSSNNYIDNDLNQDFKQHLAVLREKVQEKTILPFRNKISRINSTPDQTYHQQLLDKDQALQAFEKDLHAFALQLDEKEKELEKRVTELTTREEHATKNQLNHAEVLKLLREEKEAVKGEQQILRTHQASILKEREAFKTKSEMLEQKISDLEGQLLEKEQNIQALKQIEQEGKAELIQREEKLSVKEQLFEEKLAKLTISEKTFQEKSELLTKDREDMQTEKKDLEKEIKALKETISKLKKENFNEKNHHKKIEEDHIGLLVGIKKLVKDEDVISSSSSYTSASELTGLPDSPLRTAASPTFFKQPAANHSNLETPTTTLVVS